ncbi:unnamed protein product [Bursaphelenchus xylophilus]|uniref:(pine wood nematode) hypothetical protein n=1 Tax=Bursaphelenchus xylophilus TaxID=6326 RepID=A0A1I7SL59_BURXY|nr:unnamed protein product [Bursaphelenchus xylophilus]CAG9129378.1 unnamed protein product [Bursaphelenchus xylophilus]
MTEYWKSSAKKFCEICKVWFGDNRASIEHHEMGQKHKAMVQQRLREMGQKTKQKDKETANLNATLVAMEAAARAAMERDGQSVPTPASMAPPMVGVLPTTSAPSHGSGTPAPVKRKAPKIDPKEELKERKKKLKELKKTAATSEFWNRNEEEEIIEWVQAEANGGFYYWNIFSGETLWEVPTIFYTSEEYSQNYEKIQKQIEDEKNRLKEEEERKKKEAENAEAMKQYNEQYQQYYKQWYEYQIQMQQYAAQAPPPPPPAESKDNIKNVGIEQTNGGNAEKVNFEAPEGLIEVPSEIKDQGIQEEEVKKEEEEDQPRPECTFYDPLAEEEAEKPKKSAYGLGKWTPVVKQPEIPKNFELEQQVQPVYDDLPDTTTKPDLDFEIEEDPSETQFGEKVLKVKSSKKDKPIVFQKRKARNQNQRRTGGDF